MVKELAEMNLNHTGGGKVLRAVPSARWKAKKEGIDLSLIKGTGPDGQILLKDIERFKKTKEAIQRACPPGKNIGFVLSAKVSEKRGSLS